MDITHVVGQSPRLEFPGTVNESWLNGKTIVITGGASGFGAASVRRWAKAGACVIFGDINTNAGKTLEAEVRKAASNPHVHFVRCDVTDWSSQVALFKEAVKFSPHGGIDTVVANAGITDKRMAFENPEGLDADNPPPPRLDVLDVNLTGVVYTSHLAIYWLKRNPGSQPVSIHTNPEKTKRDRHLILIGSMASLGPIPLQSFYGASKHAVLGLYRCLRSTSFLHGFRVSFIAPYFIDTPILPPVARMLLAGAELGNKDDVVEAMTRFATDPRIIGRAVVVSPRLTIKKLEDGSECLLPRGDKDGEERAVWEFVAGDFEAVEVWNRRLIGILNAAEKAKGWTGWAYDMAAAMALAAGNLWRHGPKAVV